MGTTVEPEQETKIRHQPTYNVILLNDNDHTVIYVISMMQAIFGYSVEKGFIIAKEVHEKGRCIVWTGSFEVAELKQEQIHAFGADKLVPRCKGSMTAELEAN